MQHIKMNANINLEKFISVTGKYFHKLENLKWKNGCQIEILCHDKYLLNFVTMIHKKKKKKEKC